MIIRLLQTQITQNVHITDIFKNKLFNYIFLEYIVPIIGND